MSKLHQIAFAKHPCSGSVIFIHGLEGHPFDTWRKRKDLGWAQDPSFWPLWLSDDLPNLNIYTLEFPAAASNWTGTAMPLEDRAGNILEHILVEPIALQGPVIFVCHSLGGLVVKQLIRKADGDRDARTEAGDFLNKLCGVIFIATPHTGSSLANTLSLFGRISRLSSATQDLIKNEPTLRDLNVWYRNRSVRQAGSFSHRVFYEMRSTYGVTTVTPESADPGLINTSLVAIDADHIEIAKPNERSDLIYKSVLDFLQKEVARGPFVP